MAFLRSFGPLGFEIHIFCCNTLCLVYLAWQRARQPISATRDFSVQKPEVSGRISRIIVSFAVRSEFAPWRRLRNFERVGDPAARVYSANGSGAGIDVVLTGVGGRNLAAMRKLLEEGTDIFILSGLAGSFKKKNAAGTVLVAKTIKRNNADKVMVSDDSLVKLAVQCGATPVDSFFTSDAVVASASEKLRLGAEPDARGMQRLQLMAEARRYRVPAVAIRAISDGVDE